MKNIPQNATVTIVPTRLDDMGYSEEMKKKIAGRAYEIFERRGRLPGHDIDDWLDAESEVRWELH